MRYCLKLKSVYCIISLYFCRSLRFPLASKTRKRLMLQQHQYFCFITLTRTLTHTVEITQASCKIRLYEMPYKASIPLKQVGNGCGWLTHNPEVVGSNPSPATLKTADFARNQLFLFRFMGLGWAWPIPWPILLQWGANFEPPWGVWETKNVKSWKLFKLLKNRMRSE